MDIPDVDKFKKNLDFLYDLARKAGINRSRVADETGLHKTTPYNWIKTGTAARTSLTSLLKYFQPFIDIDLTLENMIEGDLPALYSHPNTGTITAPLEPEQLSAEEVRILQLLRRWDPRNRAALYNFIKSLKP